MKTRIWIIIFLAAVLVCTFCWMYISNVSPPSKIVGIYQGGNLIEKIDLNCVTDKRELTLSGDYGKNTIFISRGHIEMKSAQCPDKLCVKHGELKNGGTPIICLPNRIVIKFEKSPVDADAKTGV